MRENTASVFTAWTLCFSKSVMIVGSAVCTEDNVIPKEEAL